jgi:hypothetical protein
MECVISLIASYEAGYVVIFAYNNDNLRLKHATSGVQNFPKMQAPPQRSVRQKVTWREIRVDDPQISSVALEILVATANWIPGHRNI